MNFSVNTNMASSGVLNNLANTQNQMQAAVAQLSSGYRINKAADDAAGLAISQKMLAQINGLNQANQNAQDGVSLIQTAEGALGQSQNILQRMRTLSVQASSDTATTTDRAQIQKEMDQLSQQLTQISNTTQFNTMHILTGQFGATGAGTSTLNVQVGANQGEVTQFNIGAADAYSLGLTRDFVASGTLTSGAAVSGGTGAAGGGGGITTSGSFANWGANIQAGYGYKLAYTAQYSASGIIQDAQLQLQDANGNNIGASVDLKNTVGSTVASGTVVTVGDTANGISFKITLTAAATGSGGVTFGASSGGFAGESGATAAGTFSETDTVTTIAPTGANAKSSAGNTANGWNGTATAGISVLSQTSASSAISTIDNAIQTLSAQRANLGALQNRLNYSMSNLQNTSQNLSAAKSNITDVNMAQEMSQFTQLNVLQQAGASILAQANQMPQVLLKLLQ